MYRWSKHALPSNFTTYMAAAEEQVVPRRALDEAVSRPNQELSAHETFYKKQRKKNLRLQTRLRKLSVRLKQAIERGDAALEQETRVALSELFLQHPELKDHTVVATRDNFDLYPGYANAQSLVQSIHSQLNDKIKASMPTPAALENDDLNLREFHTLQARSLLQHMMKGTQTEGMFDNPYALTGYTRHKFYKRSMLVIDSLGKLVGKSECTNFMDALVKVSCICSIGCGPGCDALGGVAFLKSLSPRHSKADPFVLLLDWTMDQWRDGVLNELERLLVPKHVQTFRTGQCDVRAGLVRRNVDNDVDDDKSPNKEALQLLDSAWNDRSDDSDSNITLYLVSYLLSETRDKWQTFFDDLVDRASPGSLFLLSDPTAWQLYIWLARYRERIDVVWLDSSMDRPDLQEMVRRFGPGVVLAMKR
jgi:hypothetical protein